MHFTSTLVNDLELVLSVAATCKHMHFTSTLVIDLELVLSVAASCLLAFLDENIENFLQ